MRNGAYTVLAPMLYLAMWRHSMGTCASLPTLVPEEYLRVQVDTLLAGLCLPGVRNLPETPVQKKNLP
jgi:TetR/AcrR family transcriptional regulator